MLTLPVIFGEVIPQAICVRYGLQIGAYMSAPVLMLMYVMAPIAWPTAKLLDRVLGEDHGTVYKKSGLKTLVTLHQTLGTEPGDRLNQDEVTIISAVLDLKDKPVGNIMTPMEDVFTMAADTVLDEQTMDIILSAGYSRIPIYEPGKEENFVGMLLVKILITYDPEDCKRVCDFALATLPETRPETSCLDIVNFFQEGKSHMVLVSEHPGEEYGAIGVVTLEDVIEELIGEEIVDESDVYIDIHKAVRRVHPAPRSRLIRDRYVKDNDTKNGEEDQLTDANGNDNDGENTPLLGQRKTSMESKRASGSGLPSSPKTTFLMRRTSASGEPGAPAVPVRGNLSDMREHLKHLGPSNLASRPKTTRYNTIKVKPGNGRITPDTKHRPSSIVEDPEEDLLAGVTTGEGEGLLRSAGKDAKDGVQAVQQNYGSFTDAPKSPPKEVFSSNGNATADGSNDLQPPKSSHSHLGRSPARNASRPGSRRSRKALEADSGSDTVGEMEVSKMKPKRGVARSGSITENIIDAGGVRKVVLETTSSNSDQDLEAMNEGAYGAKPVAAVAPVAPRLMREGTTDTTGSGSSGVASTNGSGSGSGSAEANGSSVGGDKEAKNRRKKLKEKARKKAKKAGKK